MALLSVERKEGENILKGKPLSSTPYENTVLIMSEQPVLGADLCTIYVFWEELRFQCGQDLPHYPHLNTHTPNTQRHSLQMLFSGCLALTKHMLIYT